MEEGLHNLAPVCIGATELGTGPGEDYCPFVRGLRGFACYLKGGRTSKQLRNALGGAAPVHAKNSQAQVGLSKNGFRENTGGAALRRHSFHVGRPLVRQQILLHLQSTQFKAQGSRRRTILGLRQRRSSKMKLHESSSSLAPDWEFVMIVDHA